VNLPCEQVCLSSGDSDSVVMGLGVFGTETRVILNRLPEYSCPSLFVCTICLCDEYISAEWL